MAHSIHIDVLTSLLDKVPEQAHSAILMAIESSSILKSLFEGGAPCRPAG